MYLFYYYTCTNVTSTEMTTRMFRHASYLAISLYFCLDNIHNDLWIYYLRATHLFCDILLLKTKIQFNLIPVFIFNIIVDSTFIKTSTKQTLIKTKMRMSCNLFIFYVLHIIILVID